MDTVNAETPPDLQIGMESELSHLRTPPPPSYQSTSGQPESNDKFGDFPGNIELKTGHFAQIHSAPDSAAIIEALIRAEQTPLQLAAELGLPLADLLPIADDPRRREQARQMCTLNADHARLLLSRFAGSAAVSLLHLSTRQHAEDPPEVIRKSCVDLLEQLRATTSTVPIAAPNGPDRAEAPPAKHAAPMSGASGPRGPSEEAILRALELIDEQHQREPQQPWLNAPPDVKLEPRMNTDKHG